MPPLMRIAAEAPGLQSWATVKQPADLIERRYRDALGKMRDVPNEALKRIETALGANDTTTETVRVIRVGQRAVFDQPADLLLENGSRESLGVVSVPHGGRGAAGSRLPPDVPMGYHTVELHTSGRRLSLIVAPQRCHLPPQLKIWAWAVQLYAARTRKSWGIGDFGDLARFAASSHQQGCGLLLLNPLHAATPVVPQQASPYSPTTRRYLNPLYLAIHEMEGARELASFERLVQAGRALNVKALIDRDQVFRLKMRALDALYRRFTGSPDFEAFVTAEGASLHEYATFCVLAEEHGGTWRRWPARYRHPRGVEVRRFAEAHRDRVRFHQWIQWHLDRQLGRVARHVPVMQDLPIGIDENGADAWAWQDVLAQGMHVGAPPDEFNTRGQDWGLPPFNPRRLAQVAYRPFIETIRGTMRHAGGLRIDHVMGLFHLYWIPDGMSPADGAFVRNPVDDLMAIVALESERAQAIVVGEDLGTVDPRARQRLMSAGVLSYRLLWFEKDAPSRYPEQALAAVTTHDLPTVAGLWSGSDLEAQQRLDLNPNEAGIREMRARLAQATGSNERTPVREVIRRTYALLANAPSTVVTATLEDAAAVEARPNMPGTVTQWPNWCQPLPVDLDALPRSPAATAIARLLSAGRRRSTSRRRVKRTG
jgi:4-alpha-glucanotransferase